MLYMPMYLRWPCSASQAVALNLLPTLVTPLRCPVELLRIVPPGEETYS